MNAEQAYVFTHTLLRDAAYQLQLPADRARLHALALSSFEAWLGVPALPEIIDGEHTPEPHPADVFAAELAAHAAASGDNPEAEQRTALYLFRAATFARRHDDAVLAAGLYLRASSCAAFNPAIQRRIRLLAVNELTLCGKLEEAKEQIAILCAQAQDAQDIESEVHTEYALAGIHWSQGKMEIAEEVLTRAIKRAVEMGRNDLADECRSGIGVLLSDRGRAQAALPNIEAALTHFRRQGSPVSVATNLGNLGLCYSHLDNFSRARSCYEEGLAIAQREGARRREGMLLCGLADLLRKFDRKKEAHPYYRKALDRLRETGDRRGEVITLNNFANLVALTGQHNRAHELRQQALFMALEMGNPLLEQLVLTGLAMSYAEDGRHEEAVERLRRSVEISRALGNTYREAMASCDLAKSLIELRRFNEARAFALRALALCDGGVSGPHRFRALAHLAHIEEGEGNFATAEQCLIDALALPVTTQTREALEIERLRLALTQVKLGKMQAARAQWQEGIKRIRGFASRAFIKARISEMRAACKAAGVPPLNEP
ncbi:MAG: tetratricopeptide repeat protein [Planctomycetes bacterium]|nr:tetratricopeptide repeat protein [Planctomycetota bacterium]